MSDKKQLLGRAINCLYLELRPEIVEDVREKILGYIAELESTISDLRKENERLKGHMCYVRETEYIASLEAIERRLGEQLAYALVANERLTKACKATLRFITNGGVACLIEECGDDGASLAKQLRAAIGSREPESTGSEEETKDVDEPADIQLDDLAEHLRRMQAAIKGKGDMK